MSTMIAEVYDALREAGASDEKSKAAAMAIADHGRFDRVERNVEDLKTDVADVKSDLAVALAELAMVKWIVSGVGFGVVLLVIRSFWAG